MLFKGGTSLSKAFGLISRFSEDIDITVFREDIGETASVESLEALSGKKRQAKLDAIKDACQAYIGGAFMEQLATYFRDTLERTQTDQPPKVELDLDDASRQSLLLWYPSVLAETDGYIRPAIKIESGAKSALDPNSSQAIRPYVADDVPALDLTVPNIVTVDAERTFWDKIIILHGLRNWFDRRGALRGGGQRVRANRTTAFWNAEMRQGDDDESDAIIQAMVTAAPRRAADSFEVLRPPTVRPPEELEPVSGDGAPIWIKRLDLRIDSGMPFRDVGGTSTIGWIRDAEPRPLDHCSLLMFADTPFPRTMVKYAELRMTATVSLSVYFHASADEIAAVGNDFVMIDVDARRSSGGFFDQRVHIWSRSGLLLATSEQMVWMR